MVTTGNRQDWAFTAERLRDKRDYGPSYSPIPFIVMLLLTYERVKWWVQNLLVFRVSVKRVIYSSSNPTW